MKKNTPERKERICSLIQTVTLFGAYALLNHLYGVGLLGCVIIGITCVVWQITEFVQHDS